MLSVFLLSFSKTLTIAHRFLAKTTEDVSMKLTCTRAIAYPAIPETNARRVNLLIESSSLSNAVSS